MGGQWSSLDNEGERGRERETTPDPFWPTTQASTSNEESTEAGKAEDGPVRLKENKKKLEEFKQELAGKREARHKAMVGLSNKLKQLQLQVDTEAEARCAAEEQVKRLKAALKEKGEQCFEEMKKKMEELEKEKEEKESQLHSLKRMASIGKEMLRIRELQVNELKKKLCETAAYPNSLREEYEAQIQNVRRLKTLYEERAEAARLEHQKELEREVARTQVLEKKIKELEKEKRNSETAKDQLKCHISKLDEALGEENDQSMTLREQLDASLLECRDLSSQMALVNNLFSKVLLGHIDVDRLTRLLRENQSLMTDLTCDGEPRNDLAALLLKIVEQIDSSFSETSEATNQDNGGSDVMTEEKVAVNLSKVWQILVQLLANNEALPSDCDSESCYKSVETPSGTKSVISVSQTFITLKTLILEKNALINEVGKLKSLNDHLETRLGSQEKRLEIVSSELKKTWGVVSKLRAQHKQLHTQEKILRYELHQKRQLLTELKEELERCRDKWTMARKKNTQSEEDWRKLRREFAERKNRQVSTSAESGYEDEELRSPPTEDSQDESGPVESNDDEVTESEQVDFDDNDLTGVEDEMRSSSRTSFYMSGENHSSSSIQSTDTVIRVDLNQLRLSNGSSTTTDAGSNNLKEVNSSEECDRLKDDTTTLSESPPDLDVPHENNLEAITEKSEEIISDFNTGQECDRPTAPTTPCTSSASAENISRFLNGLFAPEDVEKLDGYDLKVDRYQISSIEETIERKEVTRDSIIDSLCNSSSTTDRPSTITEIHKPESGEEMDECGVISSIASTKDNHGNLENSHPVPEKPKVEPSPSTSSQPSTSIAGEDHKRTPEEILDARTARLKRLEEQCKQLFSKVTATTHKSNALSTKLDQIHEQYGGSSNQKPEEVSTVSTPHEDSTEVTSPQSNVQENSNN
ncbi:coiled-coil domain-containing protein 186 isoform X2 [Nilaparvata lugens]|uniref:coiled-coil domain-containing protein 186 isoform X2 n=1 Tax=Nilaparvata lugens TaxID=108931 RepID=UPI00193CBEC4|nr:coiled-coil domain-containing protein 186 isoform X2 [Nilaparvata lugens]